MDTNGSSNPVTDNTGDRPVSVRTRGLTKAYDGKLALDDLDLEIKKGDIFGYIGPNGAGKTTTIRILAALLWPTRGTAEIEGVDVVRQPRRIKELVGYMPDNFGVYENMTLWEYLDFFGAAYRIPRSKRKRVIEDVLALTDLGPKRDDAVSAFSRGMKQRACLAKTLLHDPQVLILDEPASGLDPRARIELRELLKELQRMGKTILVSSHILTELSTICNTVGIIEKGKLIASGEVRRILESLRAHREFSLELLDPAEASRARAWIAGQAGVKSAEPFGGTVKIVLDATEPEIAALLEGLVAEKIRFTGFREDLVDLETAFMTLTKGELA
ncbi:MAG: ABC transporter ATP-binding protein [Planctomycetes bacterium]|nr:ABC transporter ATP-binding protein [Planctomycetota bacterium]